MNKTFPEIVSSEMALLLLPLKELNSAASITAFIKKLGWSFSENIEIDVNLADLTTVIEGMVGEITAFAEADDDEKVEALAELIQAIYDVIDTLKTEIPNIKTALENVPAADFSGVANDLVNVLLRRFTDYLIYIYLQKNRPRLFAFLHILGLAETTTDQEGQLVKTINWNYLGQLFSSPIELFNNTYNWEVDFDGNEFLKRFDLLVGAFSLTGGIYEQEATIHTYLNRAADDRLEIRMPLYNDGVWPGNWTEIDLNITPVPQSGPQKPGLLIYPYLQGGLNLNFDLNETWKMEFNGNADLGSGLGLEIRPPTQLNVKTDFFSSPADTLNIQANLGILTKENTETGEMILIGQSGKTRLSIAGAAFNVLVSKEGNANNFGAELNLSELKLVVSAGDGDGFLQKIMPAEGIQIAFDLGLGYSLLDGFYFSGSGTFEIPIPTHITLGPVEIRGLLIGFQPAEEGLTLSLGATLKVELGPFIGIVENMGLKTSIEFPDGGGNLGPADLSFGFKPPTGIGLSLETNIVKGGGYIFFDHDNERYGGALELSINNKLAISAIALITTRMPDGAKGFSLLLIISVQFSPGIALGMGFFLNGLGGMIGINRTINVDALRAGVKNNALDHILFPEDIIANIDEIISNIREIFPPQRDQFIIGLMAKITWGVPTPLLSLEFGLAVEFPNPIRIAILGVLKLVLPSEDKSVLRLQVNFLGIIDFEEGYLSFDASLFNSSILTMTLEGDMALRLFWGEQKAFIFSVGGFHPSFQPSASLKIGEMTRLTLNILSGNPSLNLTTYIAVTSNTVQFGAEITFHFEVSNFSIDGYFGFDVLFQFSPFKFMANIRAGVAVKLNGNPVLVISLNFDLQGPKPWVAKGNAEFKVLGIKVKANFITTWGESDQATLPKVDILPELLMALQQDLNWTSEFPEDRLVLVSLRELEQDALAEGEILLHALGQLTINQDVLPLDTPIAKFGNDTPKDIQRAKINSVLVENEAVNTEAVRNDFAPANFQDLSDQDKLSSPSFVKENSGVALTDTQNIVAGDAVNRGVSYEVAVSDYDPTSDLTYAMTESTPVSNPPEEKQDLFTQMTKGGAVGRSPLSKEQRQNRKRPEDKTVQITEPQYVLVNTSDMSQYLDSSFESGSKIQAQEALKAVLKSNPKLRGEVQIVPDYHLAELELV